MSSNNSIKLPVSNEEQAARVRVRRSARHHLHAWTRILMLCALFALCAPRLAAADHSAPEELLAEAGFDQQLNAQVPPDLVFEDESGRQVLLGDYFGTTPAILALVYYECPNLCNVLLEDLVKNLRALPFDVGKQFRVVAVSIDPDETPTLAAAKKQAYLQSYQRPGAADGWSFLTGRASEIQRLAEVVGFRYAYDAKQDQYSHPAGFMVLTPQGRIAGYFYGLQYSPTDLRLGLVEASNNKIGSPIDKVLLRCYRYDATTGTYQVVVMNVLRLTGIVTIGVLGTFIAVLFRRDRQQKRAGHVVRVS